jgi:hypothetical protein
MVAAGLMWMWSPKWRLNNRQYLKWESVWKHKPLHYGSWGKKEIVPSELITFSALNMTLVVCWDRAESSVISSADVWYNKSNQNIQWLSMTSMWVCRTVRLSAVCAITLSYCCVCRCVELLLSVQLCWVVAVCAVVLSYCCVCGYVELLLCVQLCWVVAVCAVVFSYCCVWRYVELLLCVPLCWVTAVCAVMLS